MINTLCSNLILEIISYLTDKEAKNLSNTCKTINKLGYLKYICMINSSDPFEFALAFSKHKLTLNKVGIFTDILNPQNFMPSLWPKSVMIYYSKFSTILSPNALKTEDLKIFSLYNTQDRPIKINWNKLKNLKKLYLYCDNIDLNGLENCEQLENIFIYLIKVKTISKQIGSLKNLKCIITNCDIEIGTHFISKKMNFFVTKNMSNGNFKFESTFKFVKNRNLFPYSEQTIYYNYYDIN
jgi:hypothetical protein